MTLSPGRGVLQTPTDDNNDRRRQAKQYWSIRRASNNLVGKMYFRKS